MASRREDVVPSVLVADAAILLLLLRLLHLVRHLLLHRAPQLLLDQAFTCGSQLLALHAVVLHRLFLCALQGPQLLLDLDQTLGHVVILFRMILFRMILFRIILLLLVLFSVILLLVLIVLLLYNCGG